MFVNIQLSRIMNPKQLLEYRSVLTIFRDCLKVAPRMVEDDPVKVRAVRTMMRQQFSKYRHVIDPEQILSLKSKAAKGISNYIIHHVKQQHNIPNANKNMLEEELPHEEEHK